MILTSLYGSCCGSFRPFAVLSNHTFSLLSTALLTETSTEQMFVVVKHCYSSVPSLPFLHKASSTCVCSQAAAMLI